jgi:UDP-4-amino-4,6-dideoxy-N-acetyl-beta-L-altrosamine transaminase
MYKIPYGKQLISDEDIAEVNTVLRSDFLTQGPEVSKFENAFAEYVGAKYAVAVTNGTAALHLCAMVLDVKKSQKVLTTPITFVASSNCIRYCDGDLEFIDIDPISYNLDLKLLEQKLASSPRGTYVGIILVDFAGLPVYLDQAKKIADKYGCWIIEDACHAPGAAFKTSEGAWSKSGSCEFADLSIFSFHPVKHIATGEGGMVTTNSEELYKKLLKFRTHGITRDPNEMTEFHGGWYHEMQELGYNYRISDILCALGSSQLKRADQRLEKRIQIAEVYNRELAGLSLVLPKVEANQKHAYHLYVVQAENRKELYEYLKEKGIFAQIHYLPVYKHPYYKKLYPNTRCIEAEKYYDRCLSLPMYPELTNDEQMYVVQMIKQFLKKA